MQDEFADHDLAHVSRHAFDLQAKKSAPDHKQGGRACCIGQHVNGFPQWQRNGDTGHRQQNTHTQADEYGIFST